MLYKTFYFSKVLIAVKHTLNFYLVYIFSKYNQCFFVFFSPFKVVLVRKLQKFEDIKNKHQMPANAKYKMIFEDADVEAKFNKLIAHHCPFCNEGGQEGFYKFTLLRAHIRNEHKLFYCELCAKNLKVRCFLLLLLIIFFVLYFFFLYAYPKWIFKGFDFFLLSTEKKKEID